MCPFCLASVAWMAGSVMSTGGVAAVAVQLFGAKKREKKAALRNQNEKSKSKGDVK